MGKWAENNPFQPPPLRLGAYIRGLEVHSDAINLIGARSGDRLCQFSLPYSTDLNAGKGTKDILFALYLKRATVLEKERV